MAYYKVRKCWYHGPFRWLSAGQTRKLTILTFVIINTSVIMRVVLCVDWCVCEYSFNALNYFVQLLTISILTKKRAENRAAAPPNVD